MSQIDKYFSSSEEEYKHPRISGWKALIQDPSVEVTCEVFRKREGLTYGTPKLYVHHEAKGSGQKVSDSEDWDDALNYWLYDSQVRAVSEENESLRLALTFRRLFQLPERRYGEGYFNAILIEVAARDFNFDPTIQRLLNQIGPESAHQGRSYLEALDMVQSMIREGASRLQTLEYDDGAAKIILTNAIAIYLDDRFSITNLGLI